MTGSIWFPPHNGGGDEVDLEASYDFDSDIDLYFDSDTDVDTDIDYDLNVDVCVDIDGNSATFQIDLQAFGDDSSVDLNLIVLTADDYSSITAVGHSAVG